MKWRRRRRVAWLLFGLSCVLFLAIPASMFVECGVECYGVSLDMSLGAFWFTCQGMYRWDWCLVVTEFRPESWLWPEVRKLTTPYVDVYGVPTWMPFVLCAIITIVAFRRSRRYPPGHCQSCGYDLTGNVSGRCPECGDAVKAMG